MEKGPSCRDIVQKIKQLNDLIKRVLVLASKQYLPKTFETVTYLQMQNLREFEEHRNSFLNNRLAKVSRKRVERKTTLMQNDYVNRQIPRYVFKHALS